MLQLCLLCLIVSFQNLSALEASDADGSLTLDLVQVIFRHGIRTPTKEEAKYANITSPEIYGLDFGQLTKDGMKQPYDLGKLLNRKYGEFLGDYKYETIEARSTNYLRTKMSLELLLAGLYPPTPKEQWNNELNWRPIPIDYATSKVDELLIPHQSSKFNELLSKTLKSSNDYKKELAKYSDFLNTMTKLTGYSFPDNVIYNVGWSYFLIKIHKIMNLPLPSWYTDEIYSKLEDMLDLGLNSMSWTLKLKRLNGGWQIKKVIENIENKKMKKIHLYSTHDLTMGAFARAQGLQTPYRHPPFGSAFIIESLSDKQQQKYVKMYSWDGSSNEFVEMKLNDCENVCPLNKYKSIVKDVIPTEEDFKFLHDNDDFPSCPGQLSFVAVIIIISLIIALGIAIMIVISLLVTISRVFRR